MKLEVAPKSTEVELNWHDAKFYCQMLSIDGKSEWRLPTNEELEYLYQNRYALDFEFSWYWSSTVFNSDLAYIHSFMFGGQYANNTYDDSTYVRAVRNI